MRMQGEVKKPKARFSSANLLQKHGLLVGHYLTSDTRFADDHLAPLDMPHCLKEFEYDADMASHLDGLNPNCLKKDMEFKGEFLHYEAQVSRRLLAFQSSSRWALDAMKNLIKAVRNGDGEKEDLADDLDTILLMFNETFNYTDEKIAMMFCNSILKIRDAALQKTSSALSDEFIRSLRSSDFASKDLFCFKETDLDKQKEKKRQDGLEALVDTVLKSKAEEAKAQGSQKYDFKDRQKTSYDPKRGGRGGRGRGRGRGSYQDSRDSYSYKKDYERESNRDYQESKQASSNKDQGDKSQEKYHNKGGNK